MKLSTAFVTALFSASALAAPAADAADVVERQNGAISMMAAVPQWTIENMKRVCNKANTQCTWTFAIDTHTAAATPCKFVVKGASASTTDSSNNKCGGYTIGSGWSGQFGPGNGFTTLSVVSNAKKLIIYPAYTDKQLAGGKVVKPDQSYTPQNLP